MCVSSGLGGVTWGLLLCLLSPLAQVPGVLLETEQETILVSERGSSLVRQRDKGREREARVGRGK